MTPDSIIGVLLGGGVTLVAQTVLQLVIIPRVDARKRREDRWERDVLSLGELLTDELSNAASKARHDQWLLNTLHISLKNSIDVDPKKAKQLRDELLESASESTARFRSLATVRMKWLGERVVSLAPKSPNLRKLSRQLRFYEVSALGCTLYDYCDDNFDNEQFEQNWDRERTSAKDLTATVADLAHQSRPPTSRWLTMRRTSM